VSEHEDFLDDADDDELDSTPEDVVEILGFDPKEEQDGEAEAE